VQIDLWSDFACPWCALGVYRLDKACQQFGHGKDTTVAHHSFELDPRAPARRPQTMDEVLVAKYGMSPEQIRAGHERLTALGEEVGFDFRFDRIQLGSTFDAHRLTQAARGTAIESALVKRLFVAYFTEGELLSDHQVLSRAAVEAGMAPDLAAAVLAGDAHVADVRQDEADAQGMGVTGVPYFVFNGKWAVPGAQDVDTLVRALDRAWERTEGLAQAGTTAT
jgi:predicted DsbA family dithiol-disulfide isomerase